MGFQKVVYEFTSFRVKIGSLRNDNGYGNDNAKKQ